MKSASFKPRQDKKSALRTVQFFEGPDQTNRQPDSPIVTLCLALPANPASAQKLLAYTPQAEQLGQPHRPVWHRVFTFTKHNRRWAVSSHLHVDIHAWCD